MRAWPTLRQIAYSPVWSLAALLAVSPTAHAAQSAAPEGAETTILPTVTVEGEAVPDARTEGSGSYDSHMATIAGKTAQPIREIPQSVSVITRKRMDDQNMTTIQDALRYATGIHASEYGDGTAYYKARGNLLGIEFDGVPIVGGLQYLQQFDLGIYDRIEVLRGPSGVMNGAGDPGGTVNMVRKRPLYDFHVMSETQAGTFGTGRQMFDVTGPLNDDRSLRGRLVVIGSDGLESTDNTREKAFTLYGALDYDFSPSTTLSLSGGYQVNSISALDYGAPAVFDSTLNQAVGRVPSSYTENFSPDWNNAHTTLAEGNATLEHWFDNGWKSKSTLFYRHEELESEYAYAGPWADQDGLAWYGDQRQRNLYNWYGADTHVSGPIEAFGLTHTLTFGANYSLESFTPRSGFVAVNGPYTNGTFSLYDPQDVPKVDVPFTYGVDNQIEQYGVYTQARVKLAQPLTLVLGGRETFYESRSKNLLPTEGDWETQDEFDHRFLPSAGIVYDIKPWLSTYASFSRFLTPQTATSYTGEVISPRTGEQYELGMKGDFLNKRLSATVALFRINDNNRAIADPNHATGSIAGGKTTDQGVELEITGQPLPNWNLYAGYTYLQVDYDSDGPDLSEGTDPKHQFKLWTDYTFSGGTMAGVTLGAGVLAQSHIERDVEQGGYAIFNAQVGYRLSKHVTASLQLNNIFNRDYYERPPGKFFSVFGDKRNAVLAIRANF